MKPQPTSAAADRFEEPTPENIRRYAKLMVQRINDDSWIRSYSERLLGIADNLEAQQTDDTLSELRTKLVDVRDSCQSEANKAKAAKNKDQQIASISAVGCYQYAIDLIDSAKAAQKESTD